jgi:hypothetical protein
METAIKIGWAVLAVYSVTCIWVPEIRFYWKGTGKRFGLLSSIGLIILVWSPILITAGFITEKYSFALYLIMLSAVFVMMIGAFIDTAMHQK